MGDCKVIKQNCKMNKKAVVNQADAFWQDLLQQLLLYHMEGLENPYCMMMDRMSSASLVHPTHPSPHRTMNV